MLSITPNCYVPHSNQENLSSIPDDHPNPDCSPNYAFLFRSSPNANSNRASLNRAQLTQSVSFHPGNDGCGRRNTREEGSPARGMVETVQVLPQPCGGYAVLRPSGPASVPSGSASFLAGAGQGPYPLNLSSLVYHPSDASSVDERLSNARSPCFGTDELWTSGRNSAGPGQRPISPSIASLQRPRSSQVRLT